MRFTKDLDFSRFKGLIEFRDVLFFISLAGIFYGIQLMHLPSAFIVVGSIICIISVMGFRPGK